MGVRVLLLAPMPLEHRAVGRALRGHPVDGVRTGLLGVGPDRALRATRDLLTEGPAVDHVVVTGIAGGLAPATAVGDLVVPDRVIDGRTGDVLRATPLGGLTLDRCIRTGDVDGYLDTDEDRAGYLAAGAVAVDMETAGVARACVDAAIPWTAFRAISDIAGDPSVGPAVMGMVDDDGRTRPLPALRFLATHPQRIPRMARLGRDASRAARVAAEAAVASIAAETGVG